MTIPPRPRACVTGWPVGHSRSPLIHGYWLRTYGIEGSYERVATPPGEFKRFAASIGSDGLRGANVTVPHKVAAFGACDRCTSVAEAMGAVNTIWREGGVLWGENTDAEGFLGSLDDEAPGWRREVRSGVILGAGGASRAVAYALLSAGLERITIVNRTIDRAKAVADGFGPRLFVSDWKEASDRLGDADILVNTTSLGMSGQNRLEIDISALRPGAIVADAVYVPLETALIQDARRLGYRAVGGLGMLLHQAAPGFERWFGIRPSVTSELRGLVEADILGIGAKVS
jgi:shikimate dehydrogenase